jgi:hypothetical protein
LLGTRIEVAIVPNGDTIVVTKPGRFPFRAGQALLDASRVLRHLSDLTKNTAIEWAEKAVVPIIMVTDGADWQNCQEPALKTIAKQRGVKSLATFKSRLLAAISSTLHRLARSA